MLQKLTDCLHGLRLFRDSKQSSVVQSRGTADDIEQCRIHELRTTSISMSPQAESQDQACAKVFSWDQADRPEAKDFEFKELRNTFKLKPPG